MYYGQAKIPQALIISVLLFLLYTFVLSSNFVVSILVFIYPLFIYRLFWVSNQPNFLFWGLMIQWLSVSIQLIYCILSGIALREYMKGGVFPSDLFEYTLYLSIIGLYFFALGVLVAVRRLKLVPINTLLLNYSSTKILIFYCVFSFLVYITQSFIWNFPLIVQFVYFFLYIKWGFFVITFYIIHKKNKELKWVFYLVIAGEFILGLSSYFSSGFLYILYFTLLSIAMLKPKISVRGYILLMIMGALIFHFAVLWTVSKSDYRSYLTRGQVSQTIVVSQSESFNKLIELIQQVDKEKYIKGIQSLVDRIGYLQYFAASLKHVPNVVPHQNGRVYLAAINHFLVPRFLDPDKEILDDTKHTNQFTGIRFSGAESATSFSLGAFADAYIDFGNILMFIPIFFFGYLIGILYTYFSNKSLNILWAWVFTAPFFLLINVYSIDTIKALGFIMTYFITVALIRKMITKSIDPFLKE